MTVSPQFLPRLNPKDVTPLKQAPMWVKILYLVGILIWVGVFWYMYQTLK